MKLLSALMLALAATGLLSACGDKAPPQPAGAPPATTPSAGGAPAAASTGAPAAIANPPATPAPPAVTAPVATSGTATQPPVAPAATQPAAHPTLSAPPTVVVPARGPKPLSTAKAHAPAPADAHAGLTNLGGVIARFPATWVPQQPANSMRLAQFSIPAATGAEPGEAVVFHFPAGAGGSPAENIGRWTSQFAGADGQPVQPTIRQQEIGKLAVTLVELNGTYSRGVGMGQGATTAKPNQTLLAAIVMTPDKRNITFHAYGPQSTINAQRKAFEEMVRTLRTPE